MADLATSPVRDDAEHHHPPFLQHHFDTPVQQFEAGKLGMWIFLATEVLFFAGLFCAYAIYRRNHPEIFLEAHKSLSIFWGAINTVVLITSSFTMALGVYFAQKSNRSGLVVCLALTLLGACGFMVIKGIEYSEKWQHGKLWGHLYNPHEEHPDEPAAAPATAGSGHAAGDQPAASPGSGGQPADAHAADAHSDGTQAGGAHSTAPAGATAPATAATPAVPGLEPTTIPPPGGGPSGLAAAADDGHGGHGSAAEKAKNLHLFFGIYFCMTGLHGLHVLAGMGVLSWLLIGAIQGRYNAEYYTPVDLGGLYWHLVDLIWIYLFPLLYLIH